MMTTTDFFNPTTLSQVNTLNTVTNEPSIDWSYNGFITQNNFAVTKKRLYTISGLWMEQFRSVTSQLWCTNLKIPTKSTALLGIEVLLNCARQARIQDNLIQLTLNGALIGNNYASIINPVQSSMYTGDNTPTVPLPDTQIYGGFADLWGTTLTASDVANSTFGIAISLSSNHIYPHNDLAYINQIGIRLTYA